MSKEYDDAFLEGREDGYEDGRDGTPPQPYPKAESKAEWAGYKAGYDDGWQDGYVQGIIDFWNETCEDSFEENTYRLECAAAHRYSKEMFCTPDEILPPVVLAVPSHLKAR